MRGGEWIWIMLALFGLFRLLLLAGKKKGQGAESAHPHPDAGQPLPPRRPPEDVDQLKVFIDSLTDRFGSPARPAPHAPPPPARMMTSPPPRYRDEGERPPRPLRPHPRPAPRPQSIVPPPPVTAPLPPVEAAPEQPAIGRLFSYSSNPVIQGIVFSEILGPPRSLREGHRLPSD